MRLRRRLAPRNRGRLRPFGVVCSVAALPFGAPCAARGRDWFRRTAMGLFGELCFPLGRFVPLNVPSSAPDPSNKQTAQEDR